jgi:uncharacterized protein YcfL
MKKVFLSLAVIASVALVSCGGNKAAEAADSVAEDTAVVVEVAEVAVDTAAADSAAADTVVVAEAAAVAE